MNVMKQMNIVGRQVTICHNANVIFVSIKMNAVVVMQMMRMIEYED